MSPVPPPPPCITRIDGSFPLKHLEVRASFLCPHVQTACQPVSPILRVFTLMSTSLPSLPPLALTNSQRYWLSLASQGLLHGQDLDRDMSWIRPFPAFFFLLETFSQFIQLFQKLLLSTYNIPGIALDPGNIAVNKTDKKP